MPRLLQPQDQAVPRRETVARGPVRPGERALAPDLARGCMLLVWAAIVAGLVAWTMVPAVAAVVSGDLGLLGQAPTEPTTVVYASGQDNALAAARTRIGTWLFVTLGGTLSFGGHAVMLLGFWAARRRVLEVPHNHLRMLRWTAVVGLTIGWLGGLPAALGHIGVLEVPPAAISEQGALRLIADGTGLAAGLGYVALFGLIAHRMGEWRRHPAVVAVAAVGRRSLSSYLAHSLIFAPLLAAWGLGLGALLGSATMAAFAVGVWLVTAVGAYAMARAGRQGPAEALLRRLTYGTAGRAAPAEPTRQGGVATAGARRRRSGTKEAHRRALDRPDESPT